jgi:CRP-like cAMP-binding protein
MTAPLAKLVTTLRRLPLFTDLSEIELSLITQHVTLRRYESGTIIFSEGDSCNELFLVQEGSVRLFKTAANGRQQLLGIERTGNSLAEIPVFDGDCYPATAQAECMTILLRLDAAIFRDFCLQHPEVALKVIKVLAHRLRRMGSLVEDLSFVSVRGRLIGHILSLAHEHGRTTPSGLEFELTENNEELAARLGTVRELISRNLGRLHNEGLIAISRRTVRIPELATLKAEIDRSR